MIKIKKAIALIMLISSLFIITSCGEETDYIDMVKTQRPFNGNAWYDSAPVYSIVPPTYEAVFNKFIDPVEWTENKENGEVRVGGTLKSSGTEKDIIINFRVTPDEKHGRDGGYDYYNVNPYMITVDGEEITAENEITEFLYDMFDAYALEKDFY